MKFRGHSHRSLDPKGRLMLTPDFRDRLVSEAPDGRVVLTLYEGHVVGMTPAQWSDTEEELEKVRNPSKNLRNLMRILYSGYEEVALDKQGRIQIPAHLRKSGKLDKEVVLLGAGRRFEVWGVESYRSLLEQEYDDVSEELSEAEVSLPF